MNAVAAVLRRHPFTLALLLVCAVFIVGIQYATHEASARRKGLCDLYNTQQAVIHQLVDVATTNPGAPNITALTDLPQFKALSPEEQTFWMIVLNASSGQGQTSVQQRLKDFAKDKLQPTDCAKA